MKKMCVSLLIVLSGTISVLSQSQTLQEFVIEETDNTQRFYSDEGCTPEHGALVFYTGIPNLKFTIPNAESRLKNVSDFDRQNNCYVLCVLPTDETIGSQYVKYSIKITAPGYKPEEAYIVSGIKAGVAQHFIINPKVFNNTVTVTAFDKDGKPLEGCRVGIEGMKYVDRSDNEGTCKVELPDAKPATLIISHRLYSDTVKIAVVPGDKQSARLYKLKPVVTSSSTGENAKSKKFSFGLFGGLSVANQKSDSWYYGESNKGSNIGYCAGMLFEFKLSKYVSLQPELLFVQKGGKGKTYTSNLYIFATTGDYITDVSVKSIMQLNYLEVPLNFIFNIPTGKNGEFFMGAGPSVSYGLSGKLTLNPSKEGVTFYLTDEEKTTDMFGGDEPVLKRFDLGMNVLAGYQYKTLVIRAGYNMGLNNIATNEGEGFATFTNNCFNLSLGIKF
jgi:hypothetical protein